MTRRRAHAASAVGGRSISVVIPAYRAEPVIGRALERLLEARRTLPAIREVIVVDDGSQDATSALVMLASKRHACIQLLWHADNLGKGAAVRTGMLAARGDIVMFTDADLSADVDQFPRLFRALDQGAEVAIGSRNLAHSSRLVDQTLARRLLGRAFRAACRKRLGLKQRDTQCGLKAFTREAAQAIFSRVRVERWAFDAEVLVIARELGFAVTEVAIEWRDAEGSTVRPLRDLPRVWRDLGRIRRRQRRGGYR